MRLAAFIVVALLGAVAGQARGADWQPDAMFSQVGAGSATDAWSVGWQWHWRRSWLIRDRCCSADDGISRSGAGVRSSTTRGVTTPGDAGERCAGAAPHGIERARLVRRDRFRTRDADAYVPQPRPIVSTEFNFHSHLALGHTLGAEAEHDIGLRIEHFSNAGIRSPNPGMNFASLRYTYRFGGGREPLRLAGAKQH